METIIDLEDFNKVNSYEGMFFSSPRPNNYVRLNLYLGTFDGKPRYCTILLHRLIMNCEGYLNVVDHIDGNIFDNRKCNLRVTTIPRNLKNRHSLNKNNTTGVRNVSFCNDKYVIQLQIDGKNHVFKEKFDSLEEANQFAQEMKKKYYGDFSGI